MLWGRAYFAVQAIAGAAWWVAVFTVPFVREVTLGSLDPVVVAVFDIPLFVIASAVAAFGLRGAAVVAASWTTIVALALAVFATVTTEAGWGVVIMVAAAAASIAAVLLLLLGRLPTELIVRGPFAFRPATDRPKSGVYVASTIGQIVGFWGLFLVVLPIVIVALERRWGVGFEFSTVVAPLGVLLLVLASALGLSSAFVMSTLGRGTPLPSAMPNRLVIAGPYRWVRNPMAVAGILQGVAVGLLLSSWLVVAYAVIGSLLWNYAVRPSEEADLAKRFGADFARYERDVRCWLPRVPKRRGHARTGV
jgi:protein-S-isoprenylcysteine O-methyltransferase Ste14